MTESPITLLITAGGTSEPIDEVRSISNTGTGRLGSLIAGAFSAEPSVGQIFYVCARNSLRPSSQRVTCVTVQSVADLQAAVTEITRAHPIHGIIHSMAVSDYKVRAVSTLGDLADFLRSSAFDTCGLREALARGLEETDGRRRAGKLSSQMESPLILLEPTPKILPLLREMAPDAVLVGFKLLSQVSEEELIDTAYRLLVKNGCDFVLANDSARIRGDRHRGVLIDPEKKREVFETKQEIAEGIVKAVLKEVRRRS